MGNLNGSSVESLWKPPFENFGRGYFNINVNYERAASEQFIFPLAHFSTGDFWESSSDSADVSCSHSYSIMAVRRNINFFYKVFSVHVYKLIHLQHWYCFDIHIIFHRILCCNQNQAQTKTTTLTHRRP